MPRKFQKRKINRRKNPHRRRHRKRVRPIVNRSPGTGFADVTYAKLTYVQQVTIAPTSGLVTGYLAYRGNSLFDPEVALGGHQPLYFDQYSAIYAHYRVMASKIKIDAITPSSTNGMFLVVIPNTIEVAGESMSRMYEQMRAGAPTLLPIARRAGRRIIRYASTQQVCGCTKSQVYGDEYAAATDANPAQIWFWNLISEPDDGVAADEVVLATIKLTYYCQFFDRKIVVQS